MQINSAKFIVSNTDYKKCPSPVLPEYAFIGRSNVGKSSLINFLTERNHLAKTSSTPGKTQLINHFLINANWYLVDLPGYGYAKVSKNAKKEFEKIIQSYLLNRNNLMCVFILIDSRIALQKNDEEFINWLGNKNIPFAIVYTKTDKNSKKELKDNIDNIEKKLLESWEELPTRFSTSTVKKEGKKEILDFIAKSNLLFVLPKK